MPSTQVTRRKLPGTVNAIGMASFQNDMASEPALISRYANERERGTAFGWYHLTLGISAIPAGLVECEAAALLEFPEFINWK